MQSRHLPITGPCPINLDPFQEGDGSATEHYCGHCDKDVHVLSHMTERDARAFLRAKAGQHLCIAYKVDARGSIRYRDDAPVLDDETVSLRQVASLPLPRDVVAATRLNRARRARGMWLPGHATAGTMFALALAACAPHADSVQTIDGFGYEERVDHQVPTIPLNATSIANPRQGAEVFAGEAPMIDPLPALHPDVAVAGGMTAAPIEPDAPGLVRDAQDTSDVPPSSKGGDAPCDPDANNKPIGGSVPKAGGIRISHDPQ